MNPHGFVNNVTNNLVAKEAYRHIEVLSMRE